MTITVETYLLAAEYWCPGVDISVPLVEAASKLMGSEIETGVMLSTNARCWYYLLMAEELRSDVEELSEHIRTALMGLLLNPGGRPVTPMRILEIIKPLCNANTLRRRGTAST